MIKTDTRKNVTNSSLVTTNVVDGDDAEYNILSLYTYSEHEIPYQLHTVVPAAFNHKLSFLHLLKCPPVEKKIQLMHIFLI